MYRGIVKGTGEFIHGDLISSKEAEYIHPHYNDSFLIRHDIASDIVMFEIEKKSHGVKCRMRVPFVTQESLFVNENLIL